MYFYCISGNTQYEVFFMNTRDLPLGFGMALAQNEPAMKKFESLSESEKMAFVEKTHSVNSKSEMQALVDSLVHSSAF